MTQKLRQLETFLFHGTMHALKRNKDEENQNYLLKQRREEADQPYVQLDVF